MKSPSVEPVVRSRLLPRISFKAMLGVTTIAAILAATARAADSGSEFGAAVLAACGFLAIILLLFVIVFLIAWSSTFFRREVAIAFIILGGVSAIATIFFQIGAIFFSVPIGFMYFVSVFMLVIGARMWFSRNTLAETPSSPFAADQLPPQILPPREPTK